MTLLQKTLLINPLKKILQKIHQNQRLKNCQITDSLNINSCDWKNYIIITEKKKFLFENEFKRSEDQQSPRMSCLYRDNSAPIFQCHNGLIVCKDCHPKLETCPICRDANLYDTPMTIRNQKLEEMFKRYQLSNLETAKMTSESIQIDIGILKEEYTYSR